MNAAHPDFVLSSLETADYREAVELLTEEFCRHDPVEIALGITPAEFRAMVELDLPPLVGNGLSVTAREADGNRLAGVVVGMDILSESPDCQGKISSKFAPISEIAHRFHDIYLANHPTKPGQCYYLFMTAVRSDLTRRGLCRAMTAEALARARAHGYRSAAVLATNLASRRALESQGFACIQFVPYQSYRYQGEAVFASVTDHPAIYLLELPSLDARYAVTST